MKIKTESKNQILKKIITANFSTESDLLNFARRQFGRLKLPPPAKSELLSAYHKLVKKQPKLQNKKLEKQLTKRAVRTLSGVAVISVLTKPLPCPGRCLYCPSEKNMPKSYLSNEPAVMRAIGAKFDPYRQVQMRLEALQANGHDTSKIELIVMGGTWSYHSTRYQDWFIKRCFEALNGKSAKTLIQAQKKNETARYRCIGLTLETRPDYISEAEIKRLRRLGCTRVELGIQHTDDRVLKLNRRGHSAAQGIKAIKLLKNAGFKINFHLMLNLPGSTPAKDLAMMKTIYASDDYRPDMVKIYPCVVTKNSPLHKLWRAGQYRPYSDDQLKKLLIKIKKITPSWVRITRLIRDIPEESIVAGNKITNLRQLIALQAGQEGWSCQCIRCREAGHAGKAGKSKVKSQKLKVKFKIQKYKASGGKEYFLSFESPDSKVLYAFLRLRISPAGTKTLPELRDAAIVRELHTYGQVAELGGRGEVQHLGLGKKLLAQAENITRENNLSRIAVISGIGVREYYRHLGYGQEETYMIKSLQ